MPRKVQRTKPIAVRLTDEEKLDWDLKAHAAGLSISELVRQAMNRVRISHVGDRSIQIERTRQIAKIGNNLNQIARWVNRYKTSADTVEVVTHLVAIEKALLDLSDLKPSP